MDNTFQSNSSEVNESLKYRELASIESKLLKRIKKFIIYNSYDGTKAEFATEVFLITNSDYVYAFGRNIGGKLGFGHKEEVKEPKIIPELSRKKVIDIKLGNEFSVALTQSGHIYTFGRSYDCGTGNGYNYIIIKPVEISVNNQTIITIDCTVYSTFALTQSGQLYWFGEMNGNKTYRPTKVVFPSEVKIKSISCGFDHILALNVDGKVFSWGSNNDGQLGLGHNNKTIGPQMIALNEMIKQISCGRFHSLLLTTDGKLYSMGCNESGQLGIGNKDNKNIPQLVLYEQKEICCYRDISMSLDLNNKSYVWGNILCNGVESPFATGLTSFQEVVDIWEKITEIVVSPVLSELTSFQEVVNKYAILRSTLKPIELFKPINIIIKTATKMFNNPENFDLKFKLKPKDSSEYKDIYCQKCYIKETNVYFQTMFANEWKENQKNEIEINDFSYESYYLYLKSLHTDVIDSEDMEELLEILSIADQYMDSVRKNRCVELIKEKTNNENVFSVYSNSIKYRSYNLREYAFKIISENMTDLIETQDYENMDPIYVKQFFTEFNKMQKNNSQRNQRSQRKKAKTHN